MSRIFISYRRSDSISEAGRIYDYLANRFGQEAIFKDVYDIEPGDDFGERVKAAVGQCQVLLAVIGKDWLMVTDSVGNRRLDNPADWVRLEIETALRRKVRVIPVLLEGVEMPAAQLLPEGMQPLVYRNAARVRYDPDFSRDMDKVLGVIQRQFEAGSNLTRPPTRSEPVRRATNPSSRKRTSPSVSKPQPVRSTPAIARTPSILADKISRRMALQITALAGISAGSALLVKVMPKLSLPALNTPDLTASDFIPVQFETVQVDEQGGVADRETIQSHVFKESVGDIDLELVPIKGGTFLMGSPDSEAGRADDESPQHEVNVKPFLMGKYEVTQAQWRVVAAMRKVDIDLETAPSNFKGDSNPVDSVSWEGAVEFCKRLSDYTQRDYRLPSEAEWEYACRAETRTPFYFGETLTSDIANYDATYVYGSGPKGEYREGTTHVDSFPPNFFGLCDMHGNLFEWCLDAWHENYEGAPTDGSAWIKDGDDSKRLLRGGSWNGFPVNCRSANRLGDARVLRYNFVGFRVVCGSSWTLS